MSRDIENQTNETPAAETPVVETPVVEAPVVEESVVEEPKVEEPVVEAPVAEEPKVEEPKAEEAKPEAEMPKPENVVASQTIKQDVPAENTKPDTSGQIAVYALRSLTLPSGTIPAGYSYISPAKYDQISHHKAIRKASADEVKTYLK